MTAFLPQIPLRLLVTTLVSVFITSVSYGYLQELEKTTYFMNQEDNCGLMYFPGLYSGRSAVGLVWDDGSIALQEMISALRVGGEDNFSNIGPDGEAGYRQLKVASVADEEGNILYVDYAFIEETGTFFASESTIAACSNALPVSHEEFFAQFPEYLEMQ